MTLEPTDAHEYAMIRRISSIIIDNIKPDRMSFNDVDNAAKLILKSDDVSLFGFGLEERLETEQKRAHDLANRVMVLEAEKEELLDALGRLMGGDDKMQVGIGGNPNYVDRFVGETKALIDTHRSET